MTELNRLPKCMKCDKPIVDYRLEHKEQTVVVHAQCHGKREQQEIGRMTAELMMTSLEFFGEQG